MGMTMLGVIVSCIMMAQIVVHTITDLRVFNDIPGFLLIIGSTVSVAMITYPGKNVKEIFSMFMMTFKPVRSYSIRTVVEIIKLVQETDCDPRRLEAQIQTLSNPFLREGVALVVDRFDVDIIEEIMSDRVKTNKKIWGEKVTSVKTLAKYPPAFGIMACVIGLISVMQKLGGELGPGELAPSMAIALVGTLIGLIASNYFIMPMGENLVYRGKIEEEELNIIKQGILMIAEKDSAIVVQEKLNSYLSPEERVDVLGLGSVSNLGRNAG